MGAHPHVDWESGRSALAVIERLAAQGIPSFALETVRGAPLCWDVAFPSPCALVLGNERHGLGPDVLAACAGTVQLPCVGVKNSMNVGVAFGMCTHEIARQWRGNGDSGLPGAVPDGPHPRPVQVGRGTHASEQSGLDPARS